MFRVGINGLGRIGRAILRSNLEKNYFDLVAVNDVNPDIANIAYQINYDSVHGRLEEKFEEKEGHLVCGDKYIKVFNDPEIDNVDWQALGVDIVIDASGIFNNVKRAPLAIEKCNLKHVVVTHSPKEVDFTMILGANEDKLDVNKHKVISSSICDATALAPTLKLISEQIGVESGYITTVHPWLNYQNLLDGPAVSWSDPKKIYSHYALGRSALGNIIPKPTTAVDATCKVLDDVDTKDIGSFSYRTPNAIVGSADITLNLKKETTKEEVVKLFEDRQANQKWNIFCVNNDPLVSLDFINHDSAAVVDARWIDVIKDKTVKIILWYDNEFGYSHRVIDQIKWIEENYKNVNTHL